MIFVIVSLVAIVIATIGYVPPKRNSEKLFEVMEQVSEATVECRLAKNGIELKVARKKLLALVKELKEL